jgi:hypothetical protein
METNYPVSTESFEVVLLKQGVSEFTATPDDFRRVSVRATDPIMAQHDPEVIAAEQEGYICLLASRPGIQTQAEVLARGRLYDCSVTDKSKI